MAGTKKLTDKKLKLFIKAGGRSGAKADFDKVLNKAAKNIDKK
jgi:hypothetical protein